MQIFDLLRLLDPELSPEKCKVHLAVWNGTDNPLDVYFAGAFDEWQAWQGRRNFELPFVISLISLGRENDWLFVGVYDSHGCEWVEKQRMNFYRLTRRSGTASLEGRLIVRFERTGRQSYLLGENLKTPIEVIELRRERLHVAEFPGYSATMLTKTQLDIVVRQELESWKGALGSVAGVYVIADRATGKLYVGSATGVGGIWGRWCQYSWTGHGNNVELVSLLQREGVAYANHFHYGVLEIADTHTSVDEVLEREAHWKDLLCSRAPHGYNAN